MKTNALMVVFKTASPLILGAIGGFVAVTYPAAHAAFCSGGGL